jgi:RNase P/RNase MRP subunit p29
MTLTWLIYPVTMNDSGRFIPDEKNTGIRCFYESEQFINKGNVICASGDKLYLNGSVIAELKNFFSILTDQKDVYVVTDRTIFRLAGEELRPVLTFNELINDLTYVNGEFHVSLKKDIMNGYKFSHMKISGDKNISTIDTTIVDLKKENLPEGDIKDPIVFKNSGRVLVKGN